MNTYRDITNQKFGRLTALYIDHKDNQYKEFWVCKCDCGNNVVVRKDHLLRGEILSCKCLRTEKVLEKITTHGMSKTRIYRIYRNMINRCYYAKHPEFKYWGGRGITVCKEWIDSFLDFRDWAFNNGYKEELSIDRIDVNGNYEPNNCRWATSKEQVDNRRISYVL